MQILLKKSKFKELIQVFPAKNLCLNCLVSGHIVQDCPKQMLYSRLKKALDISREEE